MSLAFWALAASAAVPQWGLGPLMQGARPGLVVERSIPLWDQQARHRTLLLLPTVSGWWHPGHYVPLQAHAHLGFREGERWFSESSVGLGATWALNARRTVRIDDDGALRSVPLAGTWVASPTLGWAVGRVGKRFDTLGRGRVGCWLPWQAVVAPSWNLELAVRWGPR